ncbi:3-oxoacyl-ACP reductase [Algimonas arctica]|uniref:3-oxoacyl-ACP reductase n=1 Tax=Algimonas arctica TaxID=1479486 RepID=A0A8J3G391_9PROT|nr:SDR family oxidoreductase [Algimonas arctica]GHB00561.1 3-oxoacyl-ACP reductase [Algimonas arctica]
MDTDFSGQTVLVIGGSSGIGNGMAQAFAARGATVHVWGTRNGVEDYTTTAGSNLTGLIYSQVDVSDRAAIDAYVPTFETLDVLICCQGIVRYGREEFTRPGWDAVMDVNITSVMDCANRFHDMLANNKGKIIIVSSVSGYQSNRGNPAYAASKAAAVSLTKSLGEAWARDNIRVNGIAPGLVDTKLTAVTTQNEERMTAALRAIPLRRAGTPDELAGAAIFLASPLSSYVVGETIIVDGGLTLS